MLCGPCFLDLLHEAVLRLPLLLCIKGEEYEKYDHFQITDGDSVVGPGNSGGNIRTELP